MRRIFLSFLLSICLVLTVPALTAAHAPDGKRGHKKEDHHHEHQRVQIDWSQYPAEFQNYKNTLDQLKQEQKGMFKEFRKQRDQIREAHKKLSDDKRQTFRDDVKPLLGELRSARDAIRTLSSEKRAAWEQFHQHATDKKWDDAKADMETIIAKKQEIIVKQKQILETQKKIMEKIPK